MKLIYLIFSMLLTVQVATGKNMSELSIKNYYSIVHRAGIYLAKGEFEKSSQNYNQAFTNISNPFFIDLNNALFVEVNRSKPNIVQINNYLKAIQGKGICIHDRYKSLPKYKPYIANITCSGCKVNNIAKVLDTIYSTDQVLRDFSKDSLGVNYDLNLLPAIGVIDSINYFRVLNLLQECINKGATVEEFFGYPAFKKLQIILLHNSPWNRSNKSLLYNLILSGAADNREVCGLIDQCCGSNYRNIYKSHKDDKLNGCLPIYQVYGANTLEYINSKIYIIPLDSTFKNIITERRNSVFLADYTEECKIKAFIAFKMDEGLYYPYLSYIQGNGFNESFERNYKGYQYIKYESILDYRFDREYSTH